MVIFRRKLYNGANTLKLFMFISDQNELPPSWDTIALQHALQTIRVDPSQAHGMAPAELMLGRKMYYPFELQRKEIDLTGIMFNKTVFFRTKKNSCELFSGTNLTASVVQGLQTIRQKNWNLADNRIKKHQKKYTDAYNKRHNVREFSLKKGDRVQIKRRNKGKSKGAKMKNNWKPLNAFYVIHEVLTSKHVCRLYNPSTKTVLKKTAPFDQIRAFQVSKKT